MANGIGEKITLPIGVGAVAVVAGALGYEVGIDGGDSSAIAHNKAVTEVNSDTEELNKLRTEPSSPQSVAAIGRQETALRTEIRQTPIPHNEQATYGYIGLGIGSGIVALSALSTFLKGRRKHSKIETRA